MASTDSEPGTTPSEERAARTHPVKPQRLDVSELAASFAGASSPFGDDLNLPLPAADLTYRQQIGH